MQTTPAYPDLQGSPPHANRGTQSSSCSPSVFAPDAMEENLNMLAPSSRRAVISCSTSRQAGDKSLRQSILSVKMFGLRDPFGKDRQPSSHPGEPIGRGVANRSPTQTAPGLSRCVISSPLLTPTPKSKGIDFRSPQVPHQPAIPIDERKRWAQNTGSEDRTEPLRCCTLIFH